MFRARARRWLARSAVAVAAATAVSVGVTSSAHAFVVPPPIPPIVSGPVVGAAAPAVVACAASVVCAAGVVGVAAGAAAWATRDTWVPWLQGLLPGADTSEAGVSAGGKPIVMGQFTVNQPAWTVNRLNTGTGAARGEANIIVVCSYSGGYSSLMLTTSSSVFSAGQVIATSGSCGTGAQVVALRAVDPGAGGYDVANYPSWASGAVTAAEKAVQYKVTVGCVVAAGDPNTVMDDTYQELIVEYSGVSGGFVYPSCAAAGIGTGQAGRVKVEATYPGSTLAPRTIWEATPPPNLEFPQCANTACKMELYYKDDPCLVGASACIDWMQRVQREGSTDYECHYGPYVVPIARCDALERTYRTGGAPLTGRNTDGNPDTWDEVKPDGSVQPGTGTGTTPGTGTGTSGGPVTVAPVPTPVTDSAADPSNESCFPTGTAAFNPVEWVLRPVKCALWWAFVPAGVGESVTDWWDVNKGNLAGTPLGQWWSSFGAWGSAFAAAGGGAAGCQGPGLPTGFLGARGVMPAVIHPWEACSGPKAIAAATVNGLLTVSIAFFSGWRIVRIVGKPFGYDLDLMNGRGEGSK